MSRRGSVLRIVRILLATEFTLESVKIIISGCAPILLTLLSMMDLAIDIGETVIGRNLLKNTKFQIALVIGLILSAIALLVELAFDIRHDYMKLNGKVMDEENSARKGLVFGLLNGAISIPVIVLVNLKLTSETLEICPNGDNLAFDNAVIWTSVLSPIIMALAPLTIVGTVLFPLWYAFLTFIYPIIYWSNPCKHVMILVISLTVPSMWSLLFSALTLWVSSEA